MQALCVRLPVLFGDFFHLLHSGSKYYLCNDMDKMFCSIEKPEKLENIFATIHSGGGGLAGLKLEDVMEIGDSEDEDEDA